MQLLLTIESSYQKTYEIVAEQIAQAIESTEEPNLPVAMKLDLLKKAHDAAYAFVDSVINAGKYTQNAELITKVQSTHMDGALAMYDRIFDVFYNYSKEGWDKA